MEEIVVFHTVGNTDVPTKTKTFKLRRQGIIVGDVEGLCSMICCSFSQLEICFNNVPREWTVF